MEQWDWRAQHAENELHALGVPMLKWVEVTDVSGHKIKLRASTILSVCRNADRFVRDMNGGHIQLSTSDCPIYITQKEAERIQQLLDRVA